VPEPKEGETQKEFVARCIPIVMEDGTADKPPQAVAVCNSMWEKAQEGKAAADDIIEQWEERAKGMSEDFLAWVKQNPPKQEKRETPAPSVAVKFLRDEDQGAVVGGYIALWGNAETKDLQGDYSAI